MTLEQATKKILISDPFYGYVLMSLAKRFDNVCERAGVSVENLNYVLHINRNFWESCDDVQQINVLKHELLHICFHHMLHWNEYPNKKALNVAEDGEINQYLDIRALERTEGGCINIFKILPGVKALAGFRYYYDLLKDMIPDDSPCEHMWESAEDLTDEEKTLIRDQAEFIMRNAAESVIKGRGTIPAELKEYINNLMMEKPPVFNWQGYVRRLLGSAEEYYIKFTRKKPSKRFDNAMGKKHRHKACLLVAVDTSGSVSSRNLADFFTEIRHVWLTGVKVDVIQCDASIHSIVHYDGKFDGKVTGRGGTDFDVVIDYYNEHRRDYNCLVYFTDGECGISVPVMGPSIWIITSDGEHKTYPGKTVYIPNDN